MQIRSILMRLTGIILVSLSIVSPTIARSLEQPSIKLAQDPARERQLEQQREAEKALKQGEQLRQDIRTNSSDRNLEQKATEQINKIRDTGNTDPEKVREAQTEINNIRKDNYSNLFGDYYLRDRYFFYPYFTTPFIPNNGRVTEMSSPSPSVSQQGFQNNGPKISVSAGFKDGKVAPAVGARWNNFGVEVGALFNTDSLPGTLNDFALPENGKFFFNDLGVKKISPQYGADILGFINVNPSVAVYGGVGVYFQTKSRIAQSQATNELYKQTDTTDVTPAVSAGVDYNVTNSFNLGIGYHSLRGITGKIGISF
jgi:opacity protein-like surface antigen